MSKLQTTIDIKQADNKTLLEEYAKFCRHDGGQYLVDINDYKKMKTEILKRMEE
ncbi:MAG: hypothetical protein ACLFUH_05830 [Bacteroidales bacterium]